MSWPSWPKTRACDVGAQSYVKSSVTTLFGLRDVVLETQRTRTTTAHNSNPKVLYENQRLGLAFTYTPACSLHLQSNHCPLWTLAGLTNLWLTLHIAEGCLKPQSTLLVHATLLQATQDSVEPCGFSSVHCPS